jgi:hypothetical protein
MLSLLTGSHRSTYDAVFQHPVARNLTWVDVRSMLVSLADVVHEHDDVLKIVRNGKTLVLHRPYRKGMGDIQELMKVRHFLTQSDVVPEPPAPDGVHLLVVIDHRLARVYRTELRDSVPQRIVPHDPTGSGRHLHHVEDDANGQRRPEPKGFYDAVAKTLQGAEMILVYGSGTGASSAMRQLLVELGKHHREIANHVVGSFVVNEQHLTENQLLAKAREFYANAAL